jgi:hypothetical protein
MVSIGLVIPSTRFSPMEPTWEFTPLSHEPGAICTREACESGRRAMAIASHQPTNTCKHMLGPYVCFGLHPGPQSPFWGETLASSPRVVYPLDFSGGQH